VIGGKDVTLRTTAIIAGVLGLLMWLTGLIADSAKADREVVATASPDTAILVIGPDVLALPGLERIAVTADGPIIAHTARPLDADAWLAGRKATQVTGFKTWETLATAELAKVVVPSPSAPASEGATPSASAQASPTATAQASPTATATPEPTASAQPGEQDDDAAPTEAEIAALYGAGDIWRHDFKGTNRLAMTGDAVAPGETIIVYSADGEPLRSVEFHATRAVNDGWIAPMLWIGVALAILGALAALSAVVDTRPMQARIEGWLSKRQAKAAGTPHPGSRRERRLAGATLPPVDLSDDPDPVAEYLEAKGAPSGTQTLASSGSPDVPTVGSPKEGGAS
jgi:biotin carboxyl carrier protein